MVLEMPQHLGEELKLVSLQTIIGFHFWKESFFQKNILVVQN